MLVLPAVAVTVPLHVFCTSGVPATFTPLGKLSVKATPVRESPLLGFVIVKVSVEVPFTAIGSGEKALLILGGSSTVRLSLAVDPVRDTGPVAVGVPVVFVTAPAVELVTFITTWQLEPDAIEAALNRTAPSPAADAVSSVFVTVPHAPGVKLKVVFCSVIPAGKVSSTFTVVNAPGLPLGLLSVKVRVVLPPLAIVVAPKALVNVGAVYTFKVSLAVLPVPPFVELTLPLVLTFAPALVAVTSTSTVQVPLAAIVPPLKLKLVSSADGDQVGEPQSVAEASGVPATFTPLGKLSVKATPVNEFPLLGLVIVKVSVEVPFTAIGSVPKLLLILGGSNTVKVSLAATVFDPTELDTSPMGIELL